MRSKTAQQLLLCGAKALRKPNMAARHARGSQDVLSMLTEDSLECTNENIPAIISECLEDCRVLAISAL
eukprot:6866351-Pyramimonas_sp.AAC.1